jgi:ABC-2 type transport system permease protein
MSQFITITRTESKLFLREWPVLFFVFALPLGLLTLFSLMYGGDGSDPAENIPAGFLPTMSIGIAISILGTAALGTVLSAYREKGILRRLSTTPVTPLKLLAAQLVVHLVAAAAVIVTVIAVGTLAFDAPAPKNLAALVVAVLGYCLVTFSIGLLLSAVLPNSKLVGIVSNVIFFPMMFFAGVWTPGDLMPESLRVLRDTTPMGAGMSAMQDAWGGSWPSAIHLVSMVALSIGCVAFAARFFRWE